MTTGASVFVAAAGLAARAGRPIAFMYFLWIGVATTAVSMVLVTAYLVLRYL
jgi:Na+/H+ antiporter NhaD/arsenite permease-like protein